jgi:hypothetical protein
MLNGGAHHSLEVEAELRIRPLPKFSKTRTAARIPQMFLTISDQDQPDRADGSRFRVIVYLPRFVERLIERLMRLLNRGA